MGRRGLGRHTVTGDRGVPIVRPHVGKVPGGRRVGVRVSQGFALGNVAKGVDCIVRPAGGMHEA